MQCSTGNGTERECSALPVGLQSASSSFTSVNGGDSADAHEEFLHLLVALAFLTVWLLMVASGMRILLKEWHRYEQQNVSEHACFRTYLEYRFGHWYAWTSGSAVIVLFTLSCTLLVLGGLLHSFVAAASISDSLWASWIWIAAPDGGNSAQPGGYVIGMFVSVGGMLIFALLVSLITSSFEQALQDLREGSLSVVEGDHTVILGWTPMTPVIIDELCNAMESRGGGTFVILATQSKPDVEKFVQNHQDQGEIQLRNSKVVVRSGQMHCKEDLRRVSVETSRKVLVLADTVSSSREEADSRTLNILLTLNGMLQHTQSCVIVECCLVRNQQLFMSLAPGPDRMEALTIQDFIGSLMVESSCQRGLASIINETLGFAGNEFYVRHIEGTKGRVFRDMLFAFPQALPVGVIKSSDGAPVKLLPPMDYVFEGDERLVLLAEDASTCPRCIPPAAPEESGCSSEDVPRRFGSRREVVSESAHVKELVVILGWNEAICSIMFELDHLIGSGSKVIVYSPRPAAERQEFLLASQKRRKHDYSSLTVEHLEGSLGARYKLDDLPLEGASKIFILAEGTARSTTEADGQTIAALLQIRDILRERSAAQSAKLVIIPQLQGKGAEEACYSSGVLDCIDSNRLSARALATVCEEPELAAVWGEFLSETGARFRLRKLTAYLASEDVCHNELTFHEVAALAASCGEIAIGWSCLDAVGNGGVCRHWEMNPADKSKPRPWNEQAFIVAVSPPRRPKDLMNRLKKKLWSVRSFHKSRSSLNVERFASSPASTAASDVKPRLSIDSLLSTDDSPPKNIFDELQRHHSRREKDVANHAEAADRHLSETDHAEAADRHSSETDHAEAEPETPTAGQFIKHLSKLADMYSQKMLTDAEFKAAKAKLLQLEP